MSGSLSYYFKLEMNWVITMGSFLFESRILGVFSFSALLG